MSAYFMWNLFGKSPLILFLVHNLLALVKVRRTGMSNRPPVVTAGLAFTTAVRSLCSQSSGLSRVPWTRSFVPEMKEAVRATRDCCDTKPHP